jgi:hypothetical protein
LQKYNFFFNTIHFGKVFIYQKVDLFDSPLFLPPTSIEYLLSILKSGLPPEITFVLFQNKNKIFLLFLFFFIYHYCVFFISEILYVNIHKK